MKGKKTLYFIVSMLLLVIIGGFPFFYYNALHQNIPTTLPSNTQAIIVLTGGSERIHIALEILKKNPNLSLLISGVPPYVSLKNITEHNAPNFPAALLKNITLGTRAHSTIGNAIEANQWIKEHNFHHIILVTSNYHMKRALLEFKQNIPEITYIAYPVQPNALQHPFKLSTISVLLHEYIKFILASLKNFILNSPLAYGLISESLRIL